MPKGQFASWSALFTWSALEWSLNGFGAPSVNQVFEKRKESPSQGLNHPAIISSITFRKVNVSLTSWKVNVSLTSISMLAFCTH